MSHRRVRHQHQVRELRAELDFQQAREVALAIDVRVDEQERLAAEQPERVGDAARGLEALALARIGNAQPEARAVADALDDALAEVRHVDHRVADPGARQALEVPGDERLAARLDQRLGDRVGERPQPLAAPGGEKHGLHASSSRSFVNGASAA